MLTAILDKMVLSRRQHSCTLVKFTQLHCEIQKSMSVEVDPSSFYPTMGGGQRLVAKDTIE